MKWNPTTDQVDAMKFLVGQPCGSLWLPMGMGKTAICLGAMNALRAKGYVGKTLVIAPIRALYTVWPREVEKWDQFRHLTVTNLHADGIDHSDVPSDIHLMNPEQFVKWTKHIASYPVHPFYDLLIIDESSLWKAHDTQRFKSIKNVLHRFPRRWTLTGTPTPKSYLDLWAQIYLLDRGESLGRFITHFRNAFTIQSPYNKYEYIVPDAAKEEIDRRIAPLLFRRELGEGTMPDLMHNTITVRLPETARKRYRELEEEFFTILGDSPITAPHAATAGMRCRQIASGAIYYTPPGKEQPIAVHVHDEKINAVQELVDTLNGRPLLLFYEFKHEADRVQEIIAAPNLSMMDGKLAEATIDAFNAGKLKVLLAHPASAGFALNLQEACADVGFITPTWNLSWEQQAIARVWRTGQRNAVTLHRIVAEDTLDERVLDALADKATNQDRLLQTILDASKARKLPVENL